MEVYPLDVWRVFARFPIQNSGDEGGMEVSRVSEQFDPEVEQIDDYKERFDFYCVAHGIADDKKKALFLSRLGQKMFAKLKIWVSPTSLSDLSLDDIVARLKNRTVPETVEIAERFRFFKRQQRVDEQVTEYMAVLRSLAKTCNFGNYLDTALRDQFVCGLREQKIQQELLCVKDLTVEQALSKSRSMETVLKESLNIHQEEGDGSRTGAGKEGEEGAMSTHKVGNSVEAQKLVKTSSSRRSRCYRCGRVGHMPDSCFHKETKCNECGKVGHLARVCRSRKSGSNIGSGRNSRRATHAMDAVVRDEHLGSDSDGSILPTVGEIDAHVSREGQTVQGHFVIVRNVGSQLPLLGRDWLCRLQLNWKAIWGAYKAEDPRICVLQSVSLLNEFPEVVKQGLGRLKGIQADIELKEGTSPRFCKCRPVPFALRAQVEEAIKKQVEEGELKPVEQSDWAAPIVIVRKKDGDIRICADFKMTINPHLLPKPFPLPTTEEVFSTLAQGESFTKLDLARAFKQMEVAEKSQPLLTITTHLGLFQYCRLPFGVATAPAMWQRAMSIVLQGCNRVVYFMDDILVTGKTRREHENNLRLVFRRLQQFGLRINISKCRFFQRTVDYLGHRISPEGIRPTEERVQGILAASTPVNKSELKSFLGLMTYNAKFLPGLSSVLHPLYKLTRKDVKWSWSRVHDVAVQQAKELVCKATTLVHYDVNKPIKLYCDASSVGVGACLMHVQDGQERPIAYASRTLTQAETMYAQIEREALAIIFAVRKFHQYLVGREFQLVTDHRPLCKIFGHDQGVPLLAAARMQRWALILSAYQYTIQYVPGELNSCADCMSRLSLTKPSSQDVRNVLTLDMQSLPVTAAEIAKETGRDTTLATIFQWVRHGNWPSQAEKHLRPFVRRRNELSCQDGCILWGARVVIPPRLRPGLLRELHDGHVGVVRMKGLARSYIWWPDLDKDIEHISESCDECRATSALPVASYHPWQYPSTPWERIHMDFGEWRGAHFLVIVDAYSKWPEVRRMRSTSTERLIDVLREIFAAHGLPRVIVSDNGPQFTSEKFTQYLISNNIIHRKSAPYHPATNGLAENMVKNVKIWLERQGKESNLEFSLLEFLRTYRNIPHTGTNKAPAEIMYGRALRTRLAMVLPSMVKRVKESLDYSTITPVRAFKKGDEVWVKEFRPSVSRKWTPGTILAPLGALTYLVTLVDGHQRKVHLDHLHRRVRALDETMQEGNPIGDNIEPPDQGGLCEHTKGAIPLPRNPPSLPEPPPPPPHAWCPSLLCVC